MLERNKLKIKILPVGMIILSIAAISNVVVDYFSFGVANYCSVIVSIIGLVGGYQYLKNGKPTNYLAELWIILQIPYIDKMIFATPTKTEYNNPIFDASQGIKSVLYLHLTSADSMLLIGFNYLPLILIGVLIYFNIPYLKKHGLSNPE